MTNEDAIKWLASIKKDLDHPRHECLGYYAQAIDEICELLEEHEPVKPIRFQPGTGNRMLKCGACLEDIKIYNYCPWCGRKVNWDDT